MADALGDTAIDSGFTYLDTLADKIYICNAEPTSYADVLTFALGNKAFSPGAAVGSPTNITGGRQVVTVAVTGGSVTSTGNATKWALVDSVNSKLLLRGSLSPSRSVVVGDLFNLNAVAVVIMTATSGAGGGGFDSATTAWIAAVGAGNVSSGRQTIINNYIVALKTAGIWPKLDRRWILASENLSSALVDIVALDLAALVGTGGTFTTDRGYAGDGSSSCINTTFNASTQGVNYTLNSAHLMVWDNTNRGPVTCVQTGVYDGVNVADIHVQSNLSSQHLLRVNDATLAAVASSSSLGMFLAQRTNSTTVEFYRNGVALTGIGPSSSTALVNLPFFVGARNDGGAPGEPTSDQISLMSYGRDFTATDAANDYSITRTFMTAVGVP